ncbi:hypothetical protein LGR54_24570 [Ancylobacter sp. Lp-2]|uniref:hypothetical protein n=1 Tax=Ancylobacter sp. Lp-2 TaxID=2881339 RepID=UPI001E2983C0|nr:hypothetical protein [Ancylobacter sp. Lp-2]MCB4767822.1 hypothetical protein [Ancylobacter sp. Lp-2]MCB4771790.1 hypothetical protein [Ancylobacter sp. Lp-2]
MTAFSLGDPTWAREARRRLVDRPPPLKAWRFEIGDRVAIIHRGAMQICTITGRSEFADRPDRYEVVFPNFDRLRRKWRDSDEISPAR